jgi:hypothetical protein
VEGGSADQIASMIDSTCRTEHHRTTPAATVTNLNGVVTIDDGAVLTAIHTNTAEVRTNRPDGSESLTTIGPFNWAPPPQGAFDPSLLHTSELVHSIGPVLVGEAPCLIRLQCASHATRLRKLLSLLPAISDSGAAQGPASPMTIDLFHIDDRDAGPDDRRCALRLDGEVVAFPTAVSHAFTHIVGLLNQLARRERPGRLHLHAASFSDGEHATLLVAPAGSGKSTLVAELATRGVCYLTDEIVAIDTRGRAHPYPKPITLKEGSWEYFRQLPTVAEHVNLAYESIACHVPATELGAPAAEGPSRPVRIVRVQFEAGADTTVRPLPRAEGACHLLANSFEPLEAGDALEMLVALASEVPAFEMTYGDAARAADKLMEMPIHHPTTFEPFESVPPVKAGDPSPSESVRSYTFGDGSLLLHSPGIGSVAYSGILAKQVARARGDLEGNHEVRRGPGGDAT